ncbi:hypothetical protein MUK42_07938 [Musa troglodytarum]|uniref:Uncharacterized protein n=1 Tax=Musa troglodytarum TaxID=320322 RepID=A0A9E7JYN9_9LILI|nr:hypothetical protein MUK42_07938 [Musa troglodytarum]
MERRSNEIRLCRKVVLANPAESKCLEVQRCPVECRGRGGSWTINMVFMEVKMPWNVKISLELLDARGTILHKAIILRLVDDIAIRTR